jgi:hypothetical protein
MTTKHTPGPWRLCDLDEFPWECYNTGVPGESTITILDGNGYGVLSVPLSTTDRNMANARLIAAAPDLLEVCEQLVGMVTRENCAPTEEDGEEYELWKQLLAAVAKATGQDDTP